MSGVWRGEAVRIATNYGRILVSFAIGVFLVRTLLGFGEAVFNVYAVVVIGGGVGVMLRELLRKAILPDLAAAYAAEEFGPRFAQASAAAQRTALAGAALGVALLATMGLLLDRLSVDPALVDAGRLFIACRAAQVALGVSLSPLLTLPLAMRRQALANVLLLLERIAELVGVLAALLLAPDDPVAQLTWFALAGSGAFALLYGGAALALLRRWPQARPRLRGAGTASMSRLLRRTAWTTGMVLATNIYLRFDVLFVSAVLGAGATVAFAIAVQLTGWVRQIAAGLANGLDAVWAHMGAGRGRRDERTLLALSSALQASVTLLATGFVAVSIEDILALWLGGTGVSAASLDLAATVTLLLMLGIAARSLTEGWRTMINGQGRVDAYVRWLLPLSLLNPVLVTLVAWDAAPETGLVRIAVVFAMLQMLGHGVLVTRVAARQLGLPVGALLAPFVAPLVAALTATAVAWSLPVFAPMGPLATVAAGVAVFAVAFVALGGVMVAQVRRARRAAA